MLTQPYEPFVSCQLPRSGASVKSKIASAEIFSNISRRPKDAPGSLARKATAAKGRRHETPELARTSHRGQARHRGGRSPVHQERAAERSLGYGQGLRRRGRPACAAGAASAWRRPVPCATRRAAAIAPQAASKRLPDVLTSRRALFLACRAKATVPHLSLVRSPGWRWAAN